MKLSELEILIPTGAVSGIVVYRPSDSESWIIDVEFDDPPPRIKSSLLKSARDEIRTFATVDSALKVIRAAGWYQTVTVQG